MPLATPLAQMRFSLRARPTPADRLRNSPPLNGGSDNPGRGEKQSASVGLNRIFARRGGQGHIALATPAATGDAEAGSLTAPVPAGHPGEHDRRVQVGETDFLKSTGRMSDEAWRAEELRPGPSSRPPGTRRVRAGWPGAQR